MDITLTPELEKGVLARVERGDYESPEELVRDAVYRLIAEDEELEETKAAISRALKESRRGEGRPAEEFFAELAARHALPR
jgi:Arc/MetJ-type ribon-helix-helix transcriptional regulator